jgi:hypothetical protein
MSHREYRKTQEFLTTETAENAEIKYGWIVPIISFSEISVISAVELRFLKEEK